MEKSAQGSRERFGCTFSHSESFVIFTALCIFSDIHFSTSLLSSKVRKSLMDKSFGPPYPAPLTFHSFNGMKTPREEELSLFLLPKILPQVPEAGTGSSLHELLRIVQDHPLLNYFHPTNELYWLHKRVSDAAELYLTPDLFKVSCFIESFHKKSRYINTLSIAIRGAQ